MAEEKKLTLKEEIAAIKTPNDLLVFLGIPVTQTSLLRAITMGLENPEKLIARAQRRIYNDAKYRELYQEIYDAWINDKKRPKNRPEYKAAAYSLAVELIGQVEWESDSPVVSGEADKKLTKDLSDSNTKLEEKTERVTVLEKELTDTKEKLEAAENGGSTEDVEKRESAVEDREAKVTEREEAVKVREDEVTAREKADSVKEDSAKENSGDGK